MSKSKRFRCADFTEEELNIIPSYYEENIEILTTKIGKSVTFKDKERITPPLTLK